MTEDNKYNLDVVEQQIRSLPAGSAAHNLPAVAMLVIVMAIRELREKLGGGAREHCARAVQTEERERTVQEQFARVTSTCADQAIEITKLRKELSDAKFYLMRTRDLSEMYKRRSVEALELPQTVLEGLERWDGWEKVVDMISACTTSNQTKTKELQNAEESARACQVLAAELGRALTRINELEAAHANANANAKATSLSAQNTEARLLALEIRHHKLGDVLRRVSELVGIRGRIPLEFELLEAVRSAIGKAG